MIREGQNSNIDDDTRARALKFVSEGGSPSDSTPKSKPKAAAKPKPKATPAKKVESKPASSVDRIPGFTKAPSTKSASVVEQIPGVPNGPKPTSGSNGTSDFRKNTAAGEFARDVRDNALKAAAALGVGGGVMKLGKMAKTAMARAAARRAPKPQPKPARDLDEERMAGEGGPNFRSGGMVRGNGCARGKTKVKTY